MSDDVSSQTEQADPLTSRTTAPPSANPARRSRRNVLIVGVLLFAALVCAANFGLLTVKTVTDRPKIEHIIDDFMRAMVAKDAPQAYALTSARFKKHTSQADVAQLFQGNNYALFNGYQHVTLTEFGVKLAFNSNPDLPHGIIAEAEGTVSYRGGIKGVCTATLEQEQGVWRLSIFNLRVPPGKFGSP